MKKEITNEQANKLLNAIFNEDVIDAEDDMPDNFPDTMRDKVGYAEHIITHDLEYIGKTLHRLSRLYGLLTVSEKDGENKLPDIIAHNELRMALEPLLQVNNDIKEATDMLVELYHATKAKGSGEADAVLNPRRCIHKTNDGHCMLHSDVTAMEYCIEGPCDDEEYEKGADDV